MAAFKFVPPGTIKQGYLIKSPPLDKRHLIDGWKKRWCVFTIVESDPSLQYYKDEQEALSTLPINRIALSSCSQVVSDMSHKSKKNVFALQLPERMYYFSAPSHLEMTEWVDVFSAKLKLTPIDGRNLPVVGTPPMLRNSPDAAKKSATLPVGISGFPQIRKPGSPLPPIPVSPDSPRPKPPSIPVPPIPIEPAVLSTYPRYSPCASPLLGENGHLSSSSPRVTLSLEHPPVPPPHKSVKGVLSSSDEEDEVQAVQEALSPPPPPPRRASSPVSSPPLSPPPEMEGDFPPPTPPPKTAGDSPSHHQYSYVT